MRTHIIEATNGEMNWGKFLIGVFDEEWSRRPMTPGCDQGLPLLEARRWTRSDVWVCDLETREGAVFQPHPERDPAEALAKHQIWVCPLFEPFMRWLYSVPLPDIVALKLPNWIDLPDAVFAFKGYRRPGQAAEGPVVHVLYHGVTHCGMNAPSSWPAGHSWVSRDDASKATCKACIEARPRA